MKFLSVALLSVLAFAALAEETPAVAPTAPEAAEGSFKFPEPPSLNELGNFQFPEPPALPNQRPAPPTPGSAGGTTPGAGMGQNRLGQGQMGQGMNPPAFPAPPVLPAGGGNNFGNPFGGQGIDFSRFMNPFTMFNPNTFGGPGYGYPGYGYGAPYGGYPGYGAPGYGYGAPGGYAPPPANLAPPVGAPIGNYPAPAAQPAAQ